MPIGEHTTRCHECGTIFTCGDCIDSTCSLCRCKKTGHMWIGNLCGRCGSGRGEQDPLIAARLLEALRQPVDQGGYDGYVVDPLHKEAADRIELLERRLAAWKQVALGVRDQYGKAVELLGEASGNLVFVARHAGCTVRQELCDILNELDARITACMNAAHVDTPAILTAELQADYNPVANDSELSACPQATAQGDGHVHDGDSTCRESTPAAVASGDQELLPSRERPCPPRDVGPNAEPC